MTRLILTLLLTTILAAPLAAQTSDLLALVPRLKVLETEPTCRGSADAGEQVILHLVIFHPSVPGIGGWRSGGFEVEGGVLVGSELAAGLDVTPDNEFQVTVGTIPDALRTNECGVVHLADVTVLVPTADAEVVIRLNPAGDGSGYTYSGPFRDQTPRDLVLHSEEDAVLAYRLAPECEPEVGNEDATWSAVKVLFR